MSQALSTRSPVGFARRFRSIVVFAGLAFGAASAGALPSAHAQSPDEVKIARQTAGDGLSAYKAGQFDKAVDLFQQAKALYPSGQVLRMLGYSQLGLERWREAAEAMEQALASTMGPLNEKDRDDVQQQLAKALAHMASVKITSRVEGAELVVDGGAAQPLPLEKPVRLVEGKHVFVVRAPEHTDARSEKVLVGGDVLAIELEPEPVKKAPVVVAKPAPKPAPAASPRKSRGWIPAQKQVGYAAIGGGVALGGAALATALVGGHLRSNVADDIDAHNAFYGEGCQRGDARVCKVDADAINRDADRADSMRTASLWMGIGAGVLAAGGAVLVVFSGSDEGKENARPAPPAREADQARLACGPLGAGLTCGGRF